MPASPVAHHHPICLHDQVPGRRRDPLGGFPGHLHRSRRLLAGRLHLPPAPLGVLADRLGRHLQPGELARSPLSVGEAGRGAQVDQPIRQPRTDALPGRRLPGVIGRAPAAPTAPAVVPGPLHADRPARRRHRPLPPALHPTSRRAPRARRRLSEGAGPWAARALLQHRRQHAGHCRADRAPGPPLPRARGCHPARSKPPPPTPAPTPPTVLRCKREDLQTRGASFQTATRDTSAVFFSPPYFLCPALPHSPPRTETGYSR